MADRYHFATLGMFIIDEFEYLDDAGMPTGRTQASQIGGGGTYASIGARMWLPAHKVGMIVDRGHDFPPWIQSALDAYGPEMWFFRDFPEHQTTRAVNRYKGEQRGFDYLTPRIRLTPKDLNGTKLTRPTTLHFVCSPSRAHIIVSEIKAVEDWSPITIYEPIPYRCVPEELPALKIVMPDISILSPNHDEALSLLSLPLPATKPVIEKAAAAFLDFGLGKLGQGCVIIRSGAMGAYVATRERAEWVDAFWIEEDSDKVVDVTGAGNSFLGGISAGLHLADGDIFKAALYATVSASYTIEQAGLPQLTNPSSNEQVEEEWNVDRPSHRLERLTQRSR